MVWEYLPYTVCYDVFCYLEYRDLVMASNVCRNWFMISRDERLWKKLFFRNYRISRKINNRGLSWCSEFKRLHFNIPIVQTETIRHHLDQVLHVTFSKSGKFFVTSSRDCSVMIWHSSYPAKLKDTIDMTVFNWRCAHFSEFNASDTLLLVSGMLMGSETSTCGEIIVFYVEDFLSSESGILKMKCRIDNTPYSLFGTWFSDSLLLSGNRFWLGGFVTAGLIYMNRASQETSSEHIPITQGIFRFYNTNRSSLTGLLAANCYRSFDQDVQDTQTELDYFEKMKFELLNIDENFDNPTLIYNTHYREYEDDFANFFDDREPEDESTTVSETSSSSDQKNEYEDKYLIFITGSNTFIPHEIGIKRIRSFRFPDRIDPGPSLKERRILLNEKKRLMESNVEDAYWPDVDAISEKFDSPDYLIDLHGHILGMRLSPDHRFLYVTIRRWPEWEEYNFFDDIDPTPSVEMSMSLNVIDLRTFKIVGITSYTSMPQYTVDPDYYFIFMDVNDELIVSTGEGSFLRIWERHYGIPLAKLEHNDIVNGAAFNPKDPEMMVSVSDDGVIKIWRSRSKLNELKIFGGFRNDRSSWKEDSDESENSE